MSPGAQVWRYALSGRRDRVKVHDVFALALLASATDRDWSVQVPGLELTVAQVVVHVADTCGA